MADNKLLAKLLRVRQDQNFDDTDSLIASAILHPVAATQKAGNWFSNQVNTAAGTGIPYDEANPFYTNTDDRVEAAFNLAGLANVSGMPFAPKNNGATLGTVLKPSFRTPYEEAHEIARINAAKPISEGGLGLPETNTAMDRAKALGFDVDNKWYRGTRTNDYEFSPEKADKNGWWGGSTYMSDNPKDINQNYTTKKNGDLEQRISKLTNQLYEKRNIVDDNGKLVLYSDIKDMVRKKLSGDNTGTIYPLYVNKNNILDVSKDNSEFLNAEQVSDILKNLKNNYGAELPEIEAKIIPDIEKYGGVYAKQLDDIVRENAPMYREVVNGDDLFNDVYRKSLVDSGYSGVLHNTEMFREAGMKIPKGTNHLAMSNPSLIRSVNAAFDPMKRNSANLLASTLLGSLLLRDKKKNETNPSQ